MPCFRRAILSNASAASSGLLRPWSTSFGGRFQLVHGSSLSEIIFHEVWSSTHPISCQSQTNSLLHLIHTPFLLHHCHRQFLSGTSWNSGAETNLSWRSCFLERLRCPKRQGRVLQGAVGGSVGSCWPFLWSGEGCNCFRWQDAWLAVFKWFLEGVF